MRIEPLLIKLWVIRQVEQAGLHVHNLSVIWPAGFCDMMVPMVISARWS
ncbi:hypothetical protein [Halomonas sp. DQ26W]|nr:hypothetical protein [Halomonas sp. DQ26W]